MSTYIYPFYKISDEIIRPWIPIVISNPINGSKIGVFALLDTGADHCVFPKAIVDQLGLDLKTGPMEIMQGLAEQKIEVWKHTFKIELQSPDRKSIVWKGKDTIICCVEHDNIPPILGFSNFMSHFKVVFNHATKKIIIDDHPRI